MIRKFQIFLIRMIAAGRPVMLNVHVSDKSITVLGDGAHIEGNTIENAPGHALHVVGSTLPRFSVGSDKGKWPCDCETCQRKIVGDLS